jgi:Icc-related predicted phosphoesterase
MWFAKSNAYKGGMNDFRMISDHQDIYSENERFTRLLPAITEDDVVVTHHLPSFRSVPPQFQNSSLNAFFVHDVENSIRQYSPSLWIHGHTHTNFDYTIGKTRVVANPRGYPEENRAFQTDFVIEV